MKFLLVAVAAILLAVVCTTSATTATKTAAARTRYFSKYAGRNLEGMFYTSTQACTRKNDIYRLKNKCVSQQQCGCQAYDSWGYFVTELKPVTTALMPLCRERAFCDWNKEGTALSVKYEAYKMPANAICTDTIPPTLDCARGFVKSGYLCVPTKRTTVQTCARYSRGYRGRYYCSRYVRSGTPCKAGYKVEKNQLCVRLGKHQKNWHGAVMSCSAKNGGSLHTIDTREKILYAGTIMRRENWDSMWLSGKVRAYNGTGYVRFYLEKPKQEDGCLVWGNYHFYKAFLDKIVLGDQVKAADITAEGLQLGIIATFGNRGAVVFKAVPFVEINNFMCEQVD